MVTWKSYKNLWVLDLMRYNYRMEILRDVMLTVFEADLEIREFKQR